MILAKWGGSLLTNKSEPGAPRFKAAKVHRLARELRAALGPKPQGAVLVHGAGSFGHPLAQRWALGRRRLRGVDLSRAFDEVSSSVMTLRRHVVRALSKAGVPSLAFAAWPLADPTRSGLRFDPAPLVAAQRLGQMPVTGGDVVLDPEHGLRVLSGDEILYHLSRALRPRRVVYATDVDGLVLDGRLIVELPSRAAPRALSLVQAGTDATGGMRGKLEWAHRIQRLGTEVLLVNGNLPGRFRDALLGRPVVATRLPAP